MRNQECQKTICTTSEDGSGVIKRHIRNVQNGTRLFSCLLPVLTYSRVLSLSML